MKHSPQSPHANAYQLAARFEEIASTLESRNRSGTFYTPLSVAERMSTDVCANFRRPENSLTLDPACGAGIFLLSMADCIYMLSGKDPSKLFEYCTTYLHAIDRDQLSVRVARALVLLFLMERGYTMSSGADIPSLEATIRVGNFLISPHEIDEGQSSLRATINPFDICAEFPHAAARRGFDIILGNPPYGLSRDEQIHPEENRILRRIYTQHREGKLNKYFAFIARGMTCLADGGILSFIVPNSWLGIRSARALRKKLLDSQSLHAITVPHWRVFPSPSVEPVIITLGKTARTAILIREWQNESASPQTKYTVHTKETQARPDHTIPLIWSENISAFASHLRARSTPLSGHPDIFVPMIAIQAYARGKGSPPQRAAEAKERSFHTRTPLEATDIPYLEGKDVRRFSLSWSGEYLRHGPWLAEPQTLARFTGPRILVREVLGISPHLFSATFVEDPFLYNKSVLHILPGKRGTREDLLALLALLNSHVGSAIIRLQGRKSQRLMFPKVVNDDLKDFPVPNGFQLMREELAHISMKFLTQGERSDMNLEHTLNELALAAYDLPKNLQALGDLLT